MERRSKSRAFSQLVSNPWTERLVNLFLVPVLLLGSLLLPPANLGARLLQPSYSSVSADEGLQLTSADGAGLTVPSGAVSKKSRIRFDALGIDDQLAAGNLGSGRFVCSATSMQLIQIEADTPEVSAVRAIPANMIVYGPLFRIMVQGETPTSASLTVPVPYELAAVETGDLYGWDGSAWRWLPSTAANGGAQLVAQVAVLPQIVLLGQREGVAPRIGLGAPAGADTTPPPASLAGALVSCSTLALGGDGELVGELHSPDELGLSSSSPAFLTISNISDGIVRSDLIDNLVITADARQQQVDNLLARLATYPFAGVQISYLGVDPDLRAEFTDFLSQLAGAVHSVGKKVAISLPEPTWDGARWDTGAYDWQALGTLADYVRIPALTQPTAYVPGGQMDNYLTWATDQIDRAKIDLSVSADAMDRSAETTRSLSYRAALSLLADSLSTTGGQTVLPGRTLNVSVGAGGQQGLAFDPESQSYSFSYVTAGNQQHDLQLETGSSVSLKLHYVSHYVLGGICVDSALSSEADPDILAVLASYQDSLATGSYASDLESQCSYVLTVEDDQGHVISRQVQPLADPNWTWTAPNNPGNYVIKAAISDDSGQTDLGAVSELDVVVPTPTFTPTPLPTNTPTPTLVPTDTPVPTPTPKPQPKAVAAPRSSAPGYFGYGIQPDMVTDGDHGRIFDHIQAMGLGWVKQQVEWFRYNPAPGQYDWGALDRIVDGANARGINVLFSVVKAPRWARPSGDTDEGPPADPNTYATFVREMAARYKGRVKAYEIWNEQNLFYEWGGRGGKLNAGRYVELLAAAYTAIKSVDPAAVVVSGALTPTGVNDGDIAIDDRVYLEQMYQAGMARYCDAVGAHPSGYNNPPDADWRTFSDPTTPNCKGHPSWFFRGTMESYRNIMVKYGDGHKRVWVTEFGWASVEGLGVGPAPNYGYAAENTEGEQAAFITRAFQLGKAWGWVGPMFLWNLNFAPVSGKADEKAAFGVVRDDWGPRPAFTAIRDMPK
jgi:hypothetical protein